jgi:hypothetical protein
VGLSLSLVGQLPAEPNEVKYLEAYLHLNKRKPSTERPRLNAALGCATTETGLSSSTTLGSSSATRVIPEAPGGVAVKTHAAATIGNGGSLYPIRPEL